MRKFFATVLLETLCLLLAGCGARKPSAPPPPMVTVATPLQMQLVDWDDYDGQFIAEDSVDVRPRVSGYLMSVGFKDGDYVRKGQVLFVIDPRPYQAALDQAKGQEAHDQAALANASDQLTRGRVLLASHAISEQAFVQLEANERQAAADLISARATVRTNALNLEFTRVVAPLAGRISDRRVAPGNLVNADTTILTNIVNLDPIWFLFTVNEADYLRYQRRKSDARSARPADPVEVRLQDDPTWRWKGRVNFVDNALDTGSGTIRARAQIDNPDHFLTPGMFGHVRLRGSVPYIGLLTPDSALVTDQSRQLVYVVGTDGKVAQKVVAPGPLYGPLRVIRTGLAPSDRVIIDGVQRAKPGLAVRAASGRIEAPASTPATAASGYISPLPSSATPADQAPASR